MREYTICEAADLASEIADRISEEVAREFDLLNTLDISDDTDYQSEVDRLATANFDSVLNALSLAKKVFDILL
jgi:hypothetical protein